MAWTASGSIEGLAYVLHIDTTAEPTLSGTADVVAMLQGREGLRFHETPIGPSADLDLTDDRSIIIALHDLTYVHDLTGDVPPVEEPARPGVVH